MYAVIAILISTIIAVYFLEDLKKEGRINESYQMIGLLHCQSVCRTRLSSMSLRLMEPSCL